MFTGSRENRDSHDIPCISAPTSPNDIQTILLKLNQFSITHHLTSTLHDTTYQMKTILFVSKEGHCLNDLLFRWKSGLLKIDIRAIISNHMDFYQLAASYNIPFHHIPVNATNKAEVERKQFEIIQNEQAELVVLARYMQILSNDFCHQLAGAHKVKY